MQEKSGNCDRIFPGFLRRFCLELLYFAACRQGATSVILLQRGIAIPVAKPPPFLGVSSLNLAAPSERPFFCADLSARGGVARRSWASEPTSLLAPGRGPKSLAKNDTLMDVKSTSLAAPSQLAKFGRKWSLIARSLMGSSHLARVCAPAQSFHKNDYSAASGSDPSGPAGKAAWPPAAFKARSGAGAPARSRPS